MISIAFTDDLASVLESLGYGVWGGGTTAGATIFDGKEPADPPACTTVYGPGGPPDTLTFDGDSNGERSAQIRFRDPDYAALKVRVEGLYKLWTRWNRYQTYYLWVKASTKPNYAYPTQLSSNGELYIGSFNVTVIQSS